jgi:hypothetical protein
MSRIKQIAVCSSLVILGLLFVPQARAQQRRYTQVYVPPRPVQRIYAPPPVQPTFPPQAFQRIMPPQSVGLGNVLYKLGRWGLEDATGSLLSDIVLGQYYSQQRGYYGSPYLPAAFRARRAY